MNLDVQGIPQLPLPWTEVTLPDNTVAWTDISPELSWPTFLTFSALIDVIIKRGQESRCVTWYVTIRHNAVAECLVHEVGGSSTVPDGVSISGAVAAGTASIQYQTTATGVDAQIQFFVRKVGVR